MVEIFYWSISALTLMGIIATIVLVLFSFKLYRRIRKLEKNLFTHQRVVDQKSSILENTISQIASAVPPDLNPEIRERRLIVRLEALIQKFSVSLNKSMQEHLFLQNNLWNEKFSSLLKILGKREQDITLARDSRMNEAWTSIVELRQKSQLLFDDMREDGIFYRLQSLWLLGSLSMTQDRGVEAWRHYVAAQRLFKDSRPKLPLTRNLMWHIAEDMLNCTKKISTDRQVHTLVKFRIMPSDIAQLYIDIDKVDARPDTLQKIRSWANLTPVR